MEYGNYFKDAFQKLSLLEQDFDISVDAGKTDELATFIADDREAIPEEPVFDTAAENEDELQDNYVGKVIIECECCHSKFYKEPEEVIIDSETQLANIEEECPFCNATMGYTVIGKIEPFDEEEPTEDEVEIEVDDEVVEPEEPAEEEVDEVPEEEVEESFNVGKFRRELNEKRKACKDDDCKVVNEFLDDEDEEESLEECGDKLTEGIFDKKPTAALLCYSEDDAFKPYVTATSYAKNGAQAIKNYVNSHGGFEVKHGVSKKVISGDQALKYANAKELKNQSIDESLTEADEYPKAMRLKNNYTVKVYNEKQEKYVLSHTPEEVMKAADEWEKDYQKSQFDESLTEDFKDVSITTDDQHLEMTSDESGKVTVTTEPLVEDSITDEPLDSEGGQEEIAPLSDEDVSEIVAQSEEAEEETAEDEEINTEDEVEFEEPEADEEGEEEEFDEFDEESFDQMGESYMRKVYDNIKSYKTTAVTESGNTLIVEGLITFNSGNTKKTTYTFSNPKMMKGDKVVLEGFNKTFSKTKKAFSLKGKIEDKKFITESLGYNYITKKLNESVRVTGRVKRILV